MNRIAIAVLLSAAALSARGQVQVKDPWVRATVSHQQVTGAFMQLSSPRNARLVEVRSPVAGRVELHETRMEHDVMRMRAVRAIDIPAGKGAELKPGGYHVMLMNLKRQVKEGETVPLTLVFEAADGKRSTVEVNAPVRPLSGHSH
jgi:copper(I)-binding protein